MKINALIEWNKKTVEMETRAHSLSLAFQTILTTFKEIDREKLRRAMQ